MKRVWIVENAVPVQALGYMPPTITNKGIRYLLESHSDAWPEQAVRDLCDSLSGEAFDLTVLLSPDHLTRFLQSGVEPPHVVIFDWEGPGFSDQANTQAIHRILESSFSFVQVYTHVGAASVEPKLQELKTQFTNRMLPAKDKEKVNVDDLHAIVVTAWNDTMAGEVADRVRAQTRTAIERVLIDLCSVKQTALAALHRMQDRGFETLLMAKLRDEIGSQGIDRLGELFKSSGTVEATDELRKLQSVFYYHFPADDLVRTGDIVVKKTGSYAMVLTPQCHLERFRNKTGGRLTLVDAEELTPNGIAALKKSGVTLSKVGGSAIASHNEAGYSVVILPNVPSKPNSRKSFIDIAVRTHAWTTLPADGHEGKPLRYADVPSVDRLCTITETCGGAIVSHIARVMASAGVPDFPDFEKARINKVLARPVGIE